MALRHKSKRRVVFRLEDMTREPEAEILIEEVIGDRERSRLLHLCMSRLHADYREALYLTNMVYRGKQSLRELLKKEGITDAKQ